MGKAVVVSAINFFEGGPLGIAIQCATALSAREDVTTLFLVHCKDLYPSLRGVEYLELPNSRKNWLYRLYYELYGIKRILSKRKLDAYISLHDFSTFLRAGKKTVYCHNSSPFYKANGIDRKYAFNFYLFTLFYGYLYGLNIRSNDFVVVQQQWMRDAFCKRYQLHPSKVVVAYPQIDVRTEQINLDPELAAQLTPGLFTFFYPALARTHKNFEDVIDAVKILESSLGAVFQVVLTIDAAMGSYAQKLISDARQLYSILFVGKQPYDSICALYSKCDCVLFPSKLETWGLPISEAKMFGKPLIAADLPYAHEALQCDGSAAFFTPGDSKKLAALMMDAMSGKLILRPGNSKKPSQPFANGWEGLLDLII